MAKFVYEAKRSPTDSTKGMLVADSKTAAIQKLVQEGWYVISLEEEDQDLKEASGGGTVLFKRIGLKSVTTFTRQLSDLMEAGLTLVKALSVLEAQTPDKRMKGVIQDIRDFCMDGNPLSAALARQTRVFSDLYVSMVRSGETGGALENILKRLADFNDKQLEIQTKVRTALAYPILMSVVGAVTIIVLVTFVVPRMMVVFSDLGQALPLPTQILLGVSYGMANYWWVVLGAIAALVVTAVRIYKTENGRLAIDRMRLSLPVIGDLIKKVEVARFSRTLATLLNNGVPILESLKVVSDSVGNAVIKKDILNAYTAVREGSSLGRAFQNSAAIPAGVSNIVAVGEEGGHLERSLFKVAEGYERESDEAVKIMMSLLEPALILVLGLVVGFIVISMLLPIFEINFLAR